MSAALKFVLLSAIGAFAFFVPIEIGGRNTIVIDHIVSFITSQARVLSIAYALLMIAWGVTAPFLGKTRKQSTSARILSYLQLIAVPLAVMYVSGVGPAFIMAPDVLPFLFEKLAVPVGLIIPVGAVFLTFMIGFGLLESIGILLEPFMRPLFRTPGLSALDAVASFVGSYSIALLITGRVYKAGMYSAREAAIIATGFSTVSTAFMLTVAKTLGLIDNWNPYFFGTLAVTFVVTAITARLPPLAGIDDTHSRNESQDRIVGSRFRGALSKGLAVAKGAPPLGALLARDLRDGLNMAARIVPSILSMGLLGLLAAKYTPVFDLIGMLLAPVVWVFFPQDALDISSIVASGLAEMFLPALQTASFDYSVRFVVAVVSVSSVLFLSGSIPCILAVGIPLTMPQLLCIWFIRTVLSIPCAFGVGYLLGVFA